VKEINYLKNKQEENLISFAFVCYLPIGSLPAAPSANPL
jgi:hypothetical protein